MRAFGFALLLLFAVPAAAAPNAELWERWTAHDPASTRTVDHSAWANSCPPMSCAAPTGSRA